MREIRDSDIRTTLVGNLDSSHAASAGALIVEEMGLLNGLSRIDVAVVNGRLQGYEIKSESDTLERLPRQVDIYSRIFDDITLVVSGKHIKRSQQIIPEWWGVSEAILEDGVLKILLLKTALHNESVNPASISALLWRDELLESLESLGLSRGIRSKPRIYLQQALANSVEIEKLKSIVRNYLKNRTFWRSGEPYR